MPDRPNLSRSDIELRVPKGDIRTGLQIGSPAGVYRYALNQDWIDEEAFVEAREWYGDRWSYTGD